MLVYRVVPENLGTKLKEGFSSLEAQTSEDAFYDLGYMNFSDAKPYFKTSSSDPFKRSKLNNFEKCNEKTKAFFLFPWDAVECSTCVEYTGIYTALGINIFEYDIPDDILKKYLGFGHYYNRAVPEFSIPMSALKGDAKLEDEYSDEIKDRLMIRYRVRGQECLDKTTQFLEKEMGYTQMRIQQFLKYFNNKEEQLKTYSFRMRKLGVSFKSTMITGRSFFISKYDVFKMRETENQTEIINKSNGILTMDNLQQYKEYRAQHEDASTMEQAEFIKQKIICDCNKDISDGDEEVTL